MSNLNSIETAPKDGTEILVEVQGYKDRYLVQWKSNLFVDSNFEPTGGWAATNPEHQPECWCEGVCWANNSNEQPSAKPIGWLPKQ